MTSSSSGIRRPSPKRTAWWSSAGCPPSISATAVPTCSRLWRSARGAGCGTSTRIWATAISPPSACRGASTRRCAAARAPHGRGGRAGHAAARRPLAEERVRVHDTGRPAGPAHRLGSRRCGPGELRRFHLPLSVRARGAAGHSGALSRGRRAEGLAASRPRYAEPALSHRGVCALRPLRRLGGDGPAARRRRVGHRRAHGFRALVPGATSALCRMTAPARLLVVTADDFGISRGVNRGIVEAHREGVVTSTSLMVNRPASVEAAELGRECPALSVGLHLELDPGGAADVPTELHRQVGRFTGLVGAPPTHVDSHHDVHKNPHVLPYVRAWAGGIGVPVRGCSSVHHLSKFYGQWGGETHLEQISLVGLLRLLDAELGPGVTELTCHAGYVDEGLVSSYTVEREAELRTLCEPRLRHALAERGIRLAGVRDLPAVAATLSVPERAAGSPRAPRH